MNGDSIHIVAGSELFTDSAPSLSLAAFVGDAPANNASETTNLSIASGGTLTITGGLWFGSSDATATVTFSGSSGCLSGTIGGDATFNDSSYSGCTIGGNAIFNDSSYNSSTIGGDAIFNNSSSNQSTVDGNATFNNSSFNNSTVLGDAAFNGSSHNYGSVFGTIAYSVLYFYNDGSQPNAHWATLSNWWKDLSHTTPATRLPRDGDTIYIVPGSNPFDDQAPALSLAAFIGDAPSAKNSETALLSISAMGTLSITGGYWFGTSDATATVTFSSTGKNAGTVNGDATFNDSSVNFTDSSFLNGIVSGNAIFNGSSVNIALISGNATFNDSSVNGSTTLLSGYVSGNATFNDLSTNVYSVSGTITYGRPGTLYFFNDGSQPNAHWTTLANWWTSAAHDTQSPRIPRGGDTIYIVAGSTPFDDQAPTLSLAAYIGDAPSAGNNETALLSIAPGGTLTVTGGNWFGTSDATVVATFSGSSTNKGTISGDATFGDSSINYGILSGNATFNDLSNNGGLVNGNATFNGSSTNYMGTVSSNATFNGSSINDSNVGGDATFNGSSSNLGTVTGTATFVAPTTAGGTYGACVGNGC